MNPAPAKAPRVIVASTSKRDAFIAVLIGLVVLAFVGYGIVHMAQPEKGNKLTGTVIEKVFKPQKEQQISFSGRRIEGTKEIAGEYVLKVRVESEKRTYEVPVEQALYEAKNLGDSLTFLRPESEQR
jgi:hypothetical protein